jgi:hypothetical protein
MNLVFTYGPPGVASCTRLVVAHYRLKDVSG